MTDFPPKTKTETSFSLATLADTTALAARLAPLLSVNDCLALEGPLGAGKTAFARALLKQLGVKDEVPSPTFTLVQTYETVVGSVFHFDLYRLKSEAELEEIGWHDALADGLVLVEWAEKAKGSLPQDALTLTFAFEGGERSVSLSPCEAWERKLKEKTDGCF